MCDDYSGECCGHDFLILFIQILCPHCGLAIREESHQIHKIMVIYETAMSYIAPKKKCEGFSFYFSVFL